MKKFTFYYSIGHTRTVTVKAKNIDDAFLAAVGALDARYIKQGKEGMIPVGWDLSLKEERECQK